jgi:protein-tyrosine-phosphatase
MSPDIGGLFGRSPRDAREARGARDAGEPADFTVLFVCTGNLCRSPTAEAIAWRELAKLPGARERLRFASAGTHALEGSPATPRAVIAAAALGADVARHRARALTRRRVRDADLVLCMAAEHRGLVLAYDRGAQRRIFTLASFARAVSEYPLPASDPAELVVMAGEEARDLPEDDVTDPIGGSAALYAAVARRIDELVAATVAALAKVT